MIDSRMVVFDPIDETIGSCYFHLDSHNPIITLLNVPRRVDFL